MDKTKALQNLLNETASEDEINLLKHGLVSGEVFIGGNRRARMNREGHLHCNERSEVQV